MAIDVEFTTPPDAPSSSDASTFRTRSDAFVAYIVALVTKLIAFVTQINATESNINAKEASAVAASEAAVGAANYQGDWAAGSYSKGVSVSKDGFRYYSKINLNTDVPPSANWEVVGTKAEIAAVIHSSIQEIPGDTDELCFWDSFTMALRKVTISGLKTVFAPLSTVGSLGAQGAQSTSFALTQAMAGKLKVLTAGGLTITLPAINSITSGSCFILRNASATSSTIALNGNSHDMGSLTIQAGETICIQNDGASFYRLLYRSSTEYISNAYGEAIKFDNGTVIMNVFVNATGSTPSTSSTTLVKQLPVQLVSPETATVTFTQNASGNFFLIPTQGYCADVNNVTIILGNTTGSARTYAVSRATVQGRWK